MDIPADEHGVLRLFSIKLEADQLSDFQQETYSEEGDLLRWPLREALGGASLDHNFIEVFPVSDLTGVGLAGYLIDGIGIPEDQVTPMRPQLDALRGHVLLIHSGGFGGRAQHLQPTFPLLYIATFTQEGADLSRRVLHSDAASPQTSATEPAPNARLWRSAIGLVFAALLGLVLWGALR